MPQETLQDIQTIAPVSIGAVGGTTLTAKHEGMLPGFFKCLTTPDAKANILSFADVRNKGYPIIWDQNKNTFTVKMHDRNLVFREKNKFYVADMTDWLLKEEPKQVLATITEKKRKYTQSEIKR